MIRILRLGAHHGEGATAGLSCPKRGLLWSGLERVSDSAPVTSAVTCANPDIEELLARTSARQYHRAMSNEAMQLADLLDVPTAVEDRAGRQEGALGPGPATAR